MRRLRVAIVGAGPAGLIAALAGRRLGLDVAVFDKAADWDRLAGAIVLHSNGLRVLHAIGALPVIEPLLRSTPCLSIERPNGARSTCFDARSLPIPQNTIATAERRAFSEYLQSAAEWAEIPITFNHRCVGLERDRDGVTLLFANGSGFACDVVLACDGIDSRVCELAGLRSTRRTSGRAYLRGIAPRGACDDRLREIHGADGRMIRLIPLINDRIGFVCSVPVGGWRGILQHQLEFWIESWARLGDDVVAVLRSVLDWEGAAYSEAREVRMPRWHHGPVFALGDAAHAMLPALDQGANAAMVDALVLTHLLVDATPNKRDLDRIGRTYQAIREPLIAKTQRAARDAESGRAGLINGWWKRDHLLRAGYSKQEDQALRKLRIEN
jgi:2-polyprenyl-6-methoxyphenol hydroxylase-like FAD-dependent oxidoreductase